MAKLANPLSYMPTIASYVMLHSHCKRKKCCLPSSYQQDDGVHGDGSFCQKYSDVCFLCIYYL